MPRCTSATSCGGVTPSDEPIWRRASASTHDTCWSRRSWRTASSRRRSPSTTVTTCASAVHTACAPTIAGHVIDEILAQLGSRYAVHNALALARYFFPVSLIPRRWRRRALELGDDVTKEVICSTLIARAFQHVGFPILPAVTPGAIDAARRRWRDWLKPGPYPHVFHREPCALITPRDFDLSPYFDVVKLTGLADREFDYRRIRWA